MSVSLLVCYFLTEIRQIWGYLLFWMRYLSEFFLRHSWDIGSLVFTLLGWAYILTFECLCAVLNFECSDLVTFWISGGQLLRPLILLISSLGNPFGEAAINRTNICFPWFIVGFFDKVNIAHKNCKDGTFGTLY